MAVRLGCCVPRRPVGRRGVVSGLHRALLRHSWRAALGGLWWLASAGLAIAQPLPPPNVGIAEPDALAAFARVFQATRLEARWFAPVLLGEVPLERLTSSRDELLRNHGAYRGALRDGDRWTVILAHARVPARIALDGRGRIRSLFFERAVVVPETLARATAALAVLPGQHAFLILDSGRERAAHDAERPLGVGSAFKLLVLREYAAALRDGRLRGDAVVALRPEWMAPGSGMIGAWPAGTQIALGTLATMMIAISDNTATDALMDLVGRGTLDAAAPARNRPLMTTRELHLLRVHPDPQALGLWRGGDVAARRGVLAALPPGRDLPLVWGDTLASDIDYLFTSRELCALITETAERPELRVNPGPAAALGWEWSAYKGGSTDTSISATILAAKSERRVCVSATWNVTPHIARDRFLTAIRGILAVLAAE